MHDPGVAVAEHGYKGLTDLQLLEIIAVEADRAAGLSTGDPERAMRRERVAAADAALYLRLRARVAARSSKRTNENGEH
jgi:hypothetical protein